MKVDPIPLSLSNAFLIRGKKNVLVDCGCSGDWHSLKEWLNKSSVSFESLSAVVLTHAHFDHCGCASFLQSQGVVVIASQRVVEPLAKGVQESSPILSKIPFGFPFASAIRRKLTLDFPSLRVDVPVEDRLDLTDFGIEGEVVSTVGHTQSSLSVLLPDRTACIGDLIMGGILGLPPAWKPNFHPASEDNTQALASMIRLRDLGFRTFHVGHGDVLTERHVDRWISENAT